MPRHQYAGAHKPPANGHDFNPFEVLYRNTPAPGWYWRPLTIAGLPDPELTGPFDTARAAYSDARAHSVEN
jgi:hypothetical protein